MIRRDYSRRRVPLLPLALVGIGFLVLAVAVSYAATGLVRGLAGDTLAGEIAFQQEPLVVGMAFAAGGVILAGFGLFLFAAFRRSYFA
jgi:hypothetical protein